MRILIADDHPLYREAIRQRLERVYPGVEVLEIADLGELAAPGAADLPALDLVLLDYHMPGVFDALGVQRAIARFGNTPTILISGLARREDVKAAITAGARGFMAKTMPADQFDDALSIVLRGGTYLPADMIYGPKDKDEGSAAGVNQQTLQGLTEILTARELQVLAALGGGATNKQIARRFELAEVTVKLHLRQIFKKIGVQNRSEAAVVAAKAGLI